MALPIDVTYTLMSHTVSWSITSYKLPQKLQKKETNVKKKKIFSNEDTLS